MLSHKKSVELGELLRGKKILLPCRRSWSTGSAAWINIKQGRCGQFASLKQKKHAFVSSRPCAQRRVGQSRGTSKNPRRVILPFCVHWGKCKFLKRENPCSLFPFFSSILLILIILPTHMFPICKMIYMCISNFESCRVKWASFYRLSSFRTWRHLTFRNVRWFVRSCR